MPSVVTNLHKCYLKTFIVARVKNNKVVKQSGRHEPTTQIFFAPHLIEKLSRILTNKLDDANVPPTKTRKIFYPDFNAKNSTNTMDVENPALEVHANVQTTNKFGLLATISRNEPISTSSTIPTQPVEGNQTKPTKQIKLPPIIIKSKRAEPRNIHVEVKNILNNQDVRILYLREEIKIYATDRSAFNTLIN